MNKYTCILTNKIPTIFQESFIKLIREYRNNINLTIDELYGENDDDKVLYFLVLDDKKVISTSRLILSHGIYGYINMVVVDKEYRGQGLCKDNIKKLIKLTNLKIYLLEVEEKNLHAVKCYESNGFKIVFTSRNLHLMVCYVK